VFEREKITLAIGDRIRFTKNVKHRGQKFFNNELRTVVSALRAELDRQRAKAQKQQQEIAYER